MFSSPGSVLAMATCRSRDGETLTTVNLADVSAEFVEPFEAPWAHRRAEPTTGNAVSLFQYLPSFRWIEQAERTLEDRAKLIVGLQHINGVNLHQRFEPFRQRRFSAADGTEQVEYLFALLEALRRMTEETDDAFNCFFHAEKFGEGRIDPNRPVHKDAAQPLIPGGVEELRIADRVQNPFGGAGVCLGIRRGTGQDTRQATSRSLAALCRIV